jgi:hypothetical protein
LLRSNGGGEIVAVGTPEDVAQEKRSYAGQYLKDVLKRPRKEAAEYAVSIFRSSISQLHPYNLQSSQ